MTFPTLEQMFHALPLYHRWLRNEGHNAVTADSYELALRHLYGMHPHWDEDTVTRALKQTDTTTKEAWAEFHTYWNFLDTHDVKNLMVETKLNTGTFLTPLTKLGIKKGNAMSYANLVAHEWSQQLASVKRATLIGVSLVLRTRSTQ